ncbi:MAG: hypothetical protein LBH43_07570 [Treponema sp.]|jgi:hypothetical protein|nr:hypothetical protein [Treponema sp.]
MTDRRSLLLLIGLFFQNLSGLPAQSGYYVIEQRYVQQLVWAADEFVLKYEVAIERDEGKGYSAFMREFTTSPSLRISLIPGNYRYRVIPFDLLEQPGEASDWIVLNIPPAPVIPVEVQSIGDDNYLLLRSDGSQFIPGVNEIIVKNPDELKNDEGVITVEKKEPSGYDKRITIYLSAAWEPLFPLYGGMQHIFGSEFYASGATLRFGAIYNELILFNPGLELTTSWYALDHAQDDYNIGMQAGVIGFNVLAQKKLLNRKLAVTLRAGGGLGFQTGEIKSEQDTYPVGGLVPQINLEPSFLWLFMKQLYLETGLGCTFFLNQTGNSCCLRPWISVGWNF